jgi:glycine cleavage system H protein
VGETFAKNESFGTVEAVKTVSDLLLPVSGEILEFNETLESEAAVVNADPYGAGWIVKIKITAPAELAELMSADEYKASIGA